MRILRPKVVRVCCLVVVLFATGCDSYGASINRMHEVEKQLPFGLTREEAYSRLRTNGLVAENYQYSHFRLVRGLFGKTVWVPVDHGEWPAPSETYPPTVEDLYLGRNQSRHSPPQPPVYVSFGGGYWTLIGNCGYETWLYIGFDPSDRISKTKEIVDRRPCPWDRV